MFQNLMNVDFNNINDVYLIIKDTIDSINNTISNPKSAKNLKNLKFDMLIFVEVLKKTKSDLEVISQDMNNNTPELYKQYGIFAYWIKRLKPFNERTTGYGNYTNETIAISFAISKINQKTTKSKQVTIIPSSVLTNLMYFIRFEQISKYGMIIILSSMFEVR